MSFLNRGAQSRRILPLSRFARRRIILESLESRSLLAGDGAQIVDVNENSAFVLDIGDVGSIVAGQPGSVYSISDGMDRDLFEIDAVTGILSFVSTPDFESPQDADSDNIYDVQVTLTDVNSVSQSVDLCAKVIDVSGLTLSYEIQDLDPNDYTLVQNGATLEIRETVSGTVVASSPANDTSLIRIIGSANPNTLVIDFTGAPISGVVEFDGGGPTTDPGDTLELVGGSVDSVEHVLTNASSGSVVVAFGATFGSATVTYTGLEPVIDNLDAVDRVFTFNGGNETITLADDAVADDGFVTIDSDSSESVTFLSPSGSLRINSGSGTDIININSLDSLYAASLIVDGGAEADDSLQMTNVDLINTGGRGLQVLEVETVTVTGGTISGNTASIGGGVLIENSTSGTDTTATFDSVTITGNTATGDTATEGGGGIYNNGANVVVSGTSIIRLNQASGVAGSGGGIFSNEGVLELNAGTVIAGNSANRAGGGVEINSGTATLTDVMLGGPLATDGNEAGINGGGLHISGDGEVTIEGGTISNNTASAEGGGLWNSSTGTLVLDATDNAITIDSNSAAGNADPSAGSTPGPHLLQGGGGIFNDGGTLTLEGATNGISIVNNTATGANFGSGGGLMSIDGTVFITNTFFQSNSAIRAGGGIEIVTGEVTLTDTSLFNNDVNGVIGAASPGNGGGLHVTGAANVTLDGGTVFGNEAAQEGGGLWNSATGTMTIIDTTIDGNLAGSAASATKAQGGGGIFNNGGMLSITNAFITGNEALDPDGSATQDEGGGGLFNLGGSVTISNTEIMNNVAINGLGNGGGILTLGGSITISDGIISGNQAARAGGGIENITGTVSLLSVILGGSLAADGNVAGINGGGLHISGAGEVTIEGGTISNNRALAEGGGLWNSSTGTLILDATDSAITIDSNSAAGNVDPSAGPTPGANLLQGGGGIFNDGGTLTLGGATNGITLVNNTATGANFGSGGGLLTIGGTVAITNTTFQSNSAIRAGGGIEVVVGTVTLTDSSLINNDVNGGIGAASPGNGGGLHVTGAANLTFNGGTVFGNEAAQEGGGLWNSATGTMTITGTTIDGNLAASAASTTKSQGGGGIFNNGGTLSISNAIITGNEAMDPDGSATQDEGGGGLFNLGGAVTISNTEVTNNIATNGLGNGGGILTSGGTVTINGGRISSNQAARAGGGIENINGTVNLTNVSLGGTLATDGNSTGINGGGLHTSGAGTVTIRGGIVQNNIAGQEGGGLWNSVTGTMSVLTSPSGGTLIRFNTANGNASEQGGGGVFNDGGQVTIIGAAINQNVSTATAVGNGGGGIFNDGDMSISDTTINGNTASSGLGNGGGILNSDGGVLVVNRSRIAGNIAARAGGGIENIVGSVALNDTLLGGPNLGDGNLANINGGGLHTSGAGTVAIFGGSILGNVAGQEGGGVWNSSTGTMIIQPSMTSNTVIRGNIANGNGAEQGGGGAFNDGGSLSIEGASIIANTATSLVSGNGGGGVMSVGGSLQLTAVEVSGNTANSGGGVNNLGVATIVDTTIAKNVASSEGGGLYSGALASSTLRSTTVAGNEASAGGGVFSISSASLASTLVAGNVIKSTTTADDLRGTYTGSYNLVGQSVPAFGTNNIVGVDWKTVLENDGTSVSLKNNGGPTSTIAILSNSPAIDAGISLSTDPIVDQRGVTRVIDLATVANATGGDGTDIGAVEVVGITISNAVANEADGTMTFVLTLTDPLPVGAVVTVQVNTSDDSAVAGVDYTAINGQIVTFMGGGPLIQTVSVVILNDVLVEIVESFNAVLSNPIGGVIADANATGTITDNEIAGFLLNKTTASVSETGTIDTFTVVLSARPSSNVVIAITSLDTSEVTIGASTASISSLTFTPANWNQPQGVALVGADDQVADGNQSTSVNVSVVVAESEPLFASVASQTVTTTTTDNEVAGFTLFSANPIVSEAGSTTTFTIVLNSQPLSNVVLDIASGDLNEVTVNLASVTFTSANWNQPQTVTVTGVNDFVDDGNKTVLVSVTVDAALSDDAFDAVASQSVSITNNDDDTVGFTVSKTTATTTEAGGTDTFTVVLDSLPLSNVVITVTSNDTGEAIPNVSSLPFTPANWNVPQTVTLTGLDDFSDDGNETLLITLAIDDLASDNAFDVLPNKVVTVTNTDNDTAGFTLNKVTSTVSESGTTDTFTVVLTSRPLSNVVLLISSADPGEVTSDAASVTFTTINWDAPQTVTLAGVADSSFDGNQTTLVTVSVDDANSDNGFDAIADQTISVLTTDIDPPAQDFGDAPTASQSGFTSSYPVTLAQDGARHTITALFLGASVNGEADGQPSTMANGDGNSDNGVFPIASQFRTATTSTRSSFRVIATQPGKLDGWIDFNRDGDWSDAGEQIFASADVQPGTNVLSYSIPAGAAAGSTAARFRISSLGGLAPTGSASDGEVEDYINTIVDGDSAAGVTINVVNGSIVLKRDASDNLVTSGTTELFRVLASSIASLNIVGTATDDTVTIDFGNGFVLPTGGVSIAGATGSNTLAVLGSGTLDLTNPNVLVTDFGSIDLPASTSNTLTLNSTAIDRLSPANKTVAISAGTNTSINLTDAEDWRLTNSTALAGEFMLNAINSVGGQIIQFSTPLAWRNFISPGDVNNSGEVTAADALTIIFELNQPQFSNPANGQLIDPLTANPFPGIYFDRSGDGRVSALDALIVINDLFQQQFGSGGGGEGESFIADFLRQYSSILSSGQTLSFGFDELLNEREAVAAAVALQNTVSDQDDIDSKESSETAYSAQAVDELLSSELVLEELLVFGLD